MNSIVKKLYVGRCYVCGKPIREDDMYGTMEDSDTLYCEACWNEYAERCDALIEQMKKEKAARTGQAAGCIFGNAPSENTCRFCGVSCGVRAPGTNGGSSTELVPSGETVGLSIMAYLDKKVKRDNGSVCGVRLEVAREWIREKLDPKHVLSEMDLDKLVAEEFASHSRTTEYGLEATYNRAELYQLIKRMALAFNARKQEQPEVDLEKEMDRFFEEMPIQEHENIFEDTYQMIARHFYELGLNARKEKTK